MPSDERKPLPDAVAAAPELPPAGTAAEKEPAQITEGEVPSDERKPDADREAAAVELPPGLTAEKGLSQPAQITEGDNVAYNQLRNERPGFFWRLLRSRADLDRYRKLEELSWVATSKQFHNLAWLLRVKQEEAFLRARHASFIAWLLTLVGAAFAVLDVVGGVLAWNRITSFVTPELDPASHNLRFVVPPYLWEVSVATTAILILIGGTAALLFKIASQFLRQADVHSRAADFTRELETAIRLSMCGADSTVTSEIARALDGLALRLIGRDIALPKDEPADLSQSDVLALLKEVRELVTSLRGRSH